MIPELMQHQATAENISLEVDSLLQDPDKVARLERYFADLHQDLKLGASSRAGEVVLRLAGAAV
jgi:lipid-A-disaccharide synthase